MTLIQLSNLFDAVTATTPGLASYWFGWPSDRLRPRATDAQRDLGAGMTVYPRVLFAVPTVQQNPDNHKDTYEVQLFFDDLLGYNEDGTADEATQLEKWRDLMNMATAWLKTLRTALPSLRPDGVAIVGNVAMVLDSFAAQQRLISVVVTMQLATNTSCGATLNFPDAIPSGIPWPPQDVAGNAWVKGEQLSPAIISTLIPWNTNSLNLTTAWQLDVFANGTRLSAGYTVAADSVTLDVSHIGKDIFIRAIWTV
jgi:hypothetical protein